MKPCLSLLWLLFFLPGSSDLSAQSDFALFKANLEVYQDSLQQNLTTAFPIPAFFQDCDRCHLAFIAPYGMAPGEPKRVRKRRQACRYFRKFGRAARKAHRAGSDYGKLHYAFKYIGQRYIIVREERILAIPRSLKYYFVCDFPSEIHIHPF